MNEKEGHLTFFFLCLKLRYGTKAIFTQRKGVDLLSTPNMTELFFSI